MQPRKYRIIDSDGTMTGKIGGVTEMTVAQVTEAFNLSPELARRRLNERHWRESSDLGLTAAQATARSRNKNRLDFKVKRMQAKNEFLAAEIPRVKAALGNKPI